MSDDAPVIFMLSQKKNGIGNFPIPFLHYIMLRNCITLETAFTMKFVNCHAKLKSIEVMISSRISAKTPALSEGDSAELFSIAKLSTLVALPSSTS